MPKEVFDVESLKTLDALLLGNRYDDETFNYLLPHVRAYLKAGEVLRTMSLGEVNNFSVMLPGGER